MKIALTYNLKKEDDTKPPDYFSEHDSIETISSIVSALKTKGHSVEEVDVESPKLFSYFSKNKVDMVFNIAEGVRGKFRESEVPAILDYLNIPYTGSGAFSLALALNKALTKKILQAEGIPTPNFQVFSKGNESLNPSLAFPLIVKPNCEGSAKGISRSSVVCNKEDLVSRVRQIIANYHQDALVEEFIEGKELTVGILENGKRQVLPILEIDFSECNLSGEYFYSWRMKEYQGDENLGLTPSFYCPARLDKGVEDKIKEVALKTHKAVGCLDISRTDIRLDKNNTPYVLEINPLPGLDPKESNFPIMAYAAGMKYEDLIEAILLSASERKGLN
ncbi:MAG: ATP-grasp domain-containing protein [Candidatus Omnitrophota bacterium]